jgi:hypothetical protein
VRKVAGENTGNGGRFHYSAKKMAGETPTTGHGDIRGRCLTGRNMANKNFIFKQVLRIN